jgi:hypothetical protein
MPRRLGSVALRCSIAVVVGCGGASDQKCTSDDQCASHFCMIDGVCGPASVDASMHASDGQGAGDGGLCSPTHDGTITSADLPLVAGRMANFLIATNATWETTGSGSGSDRSWDLTGQLANDTTTAVVLGSPSGTAWQSTFPTATYWLQLTVSSDLEGIFAFDSTSLTLVGVVSPSTDTAKTQLSYDPPATILSLPFMYGSTWTSTSTVSGYAEGVVATYQEEYQSTVDAGGTMKTPYGSFPVLRVSTEPTRTSGGVPVLTQRTLAWFAECFGSVAQATSQADETGSDFDSETEVRRLAP